VFGYVNPDKPELKVREFEVYRAYYCAVCKAIGRNAGQIPRLSLHYDLAFLALLLDALSPIPNVLLRQRCVAHPIRKHAIAAPTTVIAYAADMNVLLTYENLRDKWHDTHHVGGAMGAAVLARGAAKTARRWPDQVKAIRERLLRLNQLEKDGCEVVDEAAEPFARIMETLFACPLITDETTRRGLGWLGYNLGRWVYLMDAFDDMEEDAKKGTYNPYLRQYQYKDQPMEAFRKEVREQASFSLMYSLSEADKALKVLPVRKNVEILDNVLEAGLMRRTDEVLSGAAKKEKVDGSTPR
jgi:hypothetical protein